MNDLLNTKEIKVEKEKLPFGQLQILSCFEQTNQVKIETTLTIELIPIVE